MLRVELEDFPYNSEFNLKSGLVRAYRDEVTEKPYAECQTEAQVHELKGVLGVVGPAIEVEENREEFPGLTTHGKTVALVKALLESLNSRVALTQLKETELSHPKFASGRPRVLQMIQERLEQVRDQ